MRPTNLDGFVGQQHLLSRGKPLYHAIVDGKLHSMVLWGPPGTGKTTLARMLAERAGTAFVALSAVLSGVKDIRLAVEKARETKAQTGHATVLFVDEVHRFNKSQQDAFLPHIEDGLIVFIGATTENPSFELNNALLSRARVYVLKRPEAADIRAAIDRALTDDTDGLGLAELEMDTTLRDELAQIADGDVRRALNFLEILSDLAPTADDGKAQITESLLAEVARGGTNRQFDKGGDHFYDLISALHKSVRGSDPNAALYWLARMLDGGCDPLYLARRLVRMASEEIGNADPRALAICLDAWEAAERLGSPEGDLALAQAAAYLSAAPKSNAVYLALNAAQGHVRETGSLPVPEHLRNAPTRLMRELGHGHAYRYAHDEPDAFAAGETYFPDEMAPQRYYEPVARGLEIKIKEKLERLEDLNRRARVLGRADRADWNKAKRDD